MYVIKIDTDKLKKKDYESFCQQLSADHLKKFIVKSSKKTLIIKLPLFDYIEYEIFSKSSLIKKLRISLLQKDNNGKYQFKITRCKVGSDDYNQLLRLTRLERTD